VSHSPRALSPNRLEKKDPKGRGRKKKKFLLKKIKSKKRQLAEIRFETQKTSFFGTTNPEKMVNRVTAQKICQKTASIQLILLRDASSYTQ
jgi:hypothetical protein